MPRGAPSRSLLPIVLTATLIAVVITSLTQTMRGAGGARSLSGAVPSYDGDDGWIDSTLWQSVSTSSSSSSSHSSSSFTLSASAYAPSSSSAAPAPGAGCILIYTFPSNLPVSYVIDLGVVGSVNVSGTVQMNVVQGIHVVWASPPLGWSQASSFLSLLYVPPAPPSPCMPVAFSFTQIQTTSSAGGNASAASITASSAASVTTSSSLPQSSSSAMSGSAASPATSSQGSSGSAQSPASSSSASSTSWTSSSTSSTTSTTSISSSSSSSSTSSSSSSQAMGKIKVVTFRVGQGAPSATPAVAYRIDNGPTATVNTNGLLIFNVPAGFHLIQDERPAGWTRLFAIPASVVFVLPGAMVQADFLFHFTGTFSASTSSSSHSSSSSVSSASSTSIPVTFSSASASSTECAIRLECGATAFAARTSPRDAEGLITITMRDRPQGTPVHLMLHELVHADQNCCRPREWDPYAIFGAASGSTLSPRLQQQYADICCPLEGEAYLRHCQVMADDGIIAIANVQACADILTDYSCRERSGRTGEDDPGACKEAFTYDMTFAQTAQLLGGILQSIETWAAQNAGQIAAADTCQSIVDTQTGRPRAGADPRILEAIRAIEERTTLNDCPTFSSSSSSVSSSASSSSSVASSSSSSSRSDTDFYCSHVLGESSAAPTAFMTPAFAQAAQSCLLYASGVHSLAFGSILSTLAYVNTTVCGFACDLVRDRGRFCYGPNTGNEFDSSCWQGTVKWQTGLEIMEEGGMFFPNGIVENRGGDGLANCMLAWENNLCGG